MTSSVGTSYEAYGKKVQGIPGFIDQVDIAQTMFSSVTEENQKNMVAGTTGADNLTASLNIDGVQDTIFTGGGSDVIDLATNSNARNNRIDAGKDADTIYVSRNDRAFGSAGDDIFEATDSKGGNRMSGEAGNDTFYMGSNDRALGGNGNDKFFVSGGDNLLSGGAGVDQFWIVNSELPSSANTILDFQIGTDVIGIQGAASLGISATSLILTQVGQILRSVSAVKLSPLLKEFKPTT